MAADPREFRFAAPNGAIKPRGQQRRSNLEFAEAERARRTDRDTALCHDTFPGQLAKGGVADRREYRIDLPFE